MKRNILARRRATTRRDSPPPTASRVFLAVSRRRRAHRRDAFPVLMPAEAALQLRRRLVFLRVDDGAERARDETTSRSPDRGVRPRRSPAMHRLNLDRRRGLLLRALQDRRRGRFLVLQLLGAFQIHSRLVSAVRRLNDRRRRVLLRVRLKDRVHRAGDEPGARRPRRGVSPRGSPAVRSLDLHRGGFFLLRESSRVFHPHRADASTRGVSAVVGLHDARGADVLLARLERRELVLRRVRVRPHDDRGGGRASRRLAIEFRVFPGLIPAEARLHLGRRAIELRLLDVVDRLRDVLRVLRARRPRVRRPEEVVPFLVLGVQNQLVRGVRLRPVRVVRPEPIGEPLRRLELVRARALLAQRGEPFHERRREVLLDELPRLRALRDGI
mmetsp:Transcript_3153/g.10548  ORF Transcript_3153/g.10548 Transcript_3153/m.10548 type:complete len:385 (-) Transcript_3153:660-1814(-)